MFGEVYGNSSALLYKFYSVLPCSYEFQTVSASFIRSSNGKRNPRHLSISSRNYIDLTFLKNNTNDSRFKILKTYGLLLTKFYLIFIHPINPLPYLDTIQIHLIFNMNRETNNRLQNSETASTVCKHISNPSFLLLVRWNNRWLRTAITLSSRSVSQPDPAK